MFFKKKKKEEEKQKELLNSKIEMFLSAGMAYYKKQEYTSAKKYFQKILTIDPGNENVQRYLKEALKREKQKKVESSSSSNIQFENKETTGISFAKTEKSEKKVANSNNQKKDKLYYYKVLRIDSDASEGEIKMRISHEFKKWRTRVNSPDLKTRYEAEEMLNIISQARRTLLK